MVRIDVWRARLFITVKYGLGVGLLAWIIYITDVSRIVATVGRLSALTLTLVVAISAIGLLARTATWYVLVAYFTRVDIKQLVTADLIIKFVNSLFPSRFSGRAIAPLTLRHFTGLSWEEAMAVTVTHTGMFAMLYGSFTLLGMSVSVNAYGSALSVIILLSAAIYIVVGGAVVVAGWRLDVFDRLIARLVRLIEWFPAGDRIATPIDGFRAKLLSGSDEQFQQIIRDSRSISLFIIMWLVAVLLIPGVRLWILLTAVGVTGINPVLLPFYLIIAYSVTVLPLTPGGIGITEATAVAVFLALGFPEGEIVTVVFLDRIFGVYLPSLLGWFPLVRTNFRTLFE
jgi:uncharacterized protein (TIRG00374 family)